MAKRFRFFAWASGKSAKQGASDLRKLIWLVAIVVCFAGGAILLRQIFWAGSHDPNHPHEIGPNGGIIVAASAGEPHYHVEFVVENNGRASFFMYGSDTKQSLEVLARVFVGEVKALSDGSFTTVVFRPHEEFDKPRGRTSRFIGRIPPLFVGKELRINVPNLEIEETKVAFAFDFYKKNWPEDSSGTAQTFERKVLLTAKGDRYTDLDIEANGRVTASEKYGLVQVAHKMNPGPNAASCPVSLLQADSRLGWVVAGKERHFCCVSCIIDFLDAIEAPSKKK